MLYADTLPAMTANKPEIPQPWDFRLEFIGNSAIISLSVKKEGIVYE